VQGKAPSAPLCQIARQVGIGVGTANRECNSDVTVNEVG